MVSTKYLLGVYMQDRTALNRAMDIAMENENTGPAQGNHSLRDTGRPAGTCVEQTQRWRRSPAGGYCKPKRNSLGIL